MSTVRDHEDPPDTRSRKRRRTSDVVSNEDDDLDSDLCEISAAEWKSTTRSKTGKDNDRRCRSEVSISPPPIRKMTEKAREIADYEASYREQHQPAYGSQALRSSHLKASPIQLSTVNGLPASSNINTVSLGDILGDPLIKECWLFNYLIDVDYVMYASQCCPARPL